MAASTLKSKQLAQKSRFFLIAFVLVIVLAVGLAVVVALSQQNADTRSHASSAGAPQVLNGCQLTACGSGCADPAPSGSDVSAPAVCPNSQVASCYIGTNAVCKIQLDTGHCGWTLGNAAVQACLTSKESCTPLASETFNGPPGAPMLKDIWGVTNRTFTYANGGLTMQAGDWAYTSPVLTGDFRTTVSLNSMDIGGSWGSLQVSFTDAKNTQMYTWTFLKDRWGYAVDGVRYPSGDLNFTFVRKGTAFDILDSKGQKVGEPRNMIYGGAVRVAFIVTGDVDKSTGRSAPMTVNFKSLNESLCASPTPSCVPMPLPGVALKVGVNYCPAPTSLSCNLSTHPAILCPNGYSCVQTGPFGAPGRCVLQQPTPAPMSCNNLTNHGCPDGFACIQNTGSSNGDGVCVPRPPRVTPPPKPVVCGPVTCPAPPAGCNYQVVAGQCGCGNMVCNRMVPTSGTSTNGSY